MGVIHSDGFESLAFGDQTDEDRSAAGVAECGVCVPDPPHVHVVGGDGFHPLACPEEAVAVPEEFL